MAESTRASGASNELARLAQQLAGPRGRAQVVVDADPSMAIVSAAEDDGYRRPGGRNLGMSGRKEFLLGNVPNRVSHNARCTVIIVNTDERQASGFVPRSPASAERPPPTWAVTCWGGRPRSQPCSPSTGSASCSRAGADGARTDRAARPPLPPGARGARADLREARADAVDAPGPGAAGVHQGARALQDNVPPLTQEEVVDGDGAGARRAVGGRVRVDRARAARGRHHRAGPSGHARERRACGREGPAPHRARGHHAGPRAAGAVRREDGRPPGVPAVVDMPAVFEHLSSRCSASSTSGGGREHRADAGGARALRPAGRPDVHDELHDARLWSCRRSRACRSARRPRATERKEAARQLLESYYKQILTDGFFHADPHPGNLMWWQDSIYFLDFGMVGEVGAGMREHLCCC